jgi:recombination protein RecA
MAKKQSDDLGDLDGFFRLGAHEGGNENIPTGHFNLDFAIQYGLDASTVDLSNLEGYDPGKPLGIPLGPLVEFFGEEGSGKSSLAYRIAGFAQKLGHKVAWIDVEHSYKENLAKLNGCDVDTMLYSNMINPKDPDKPIYGENVFGYMIKAMEKGVKVIVLDSVANLIPKALYEAKDEQQFMGLLARMLSQNLGKLVAHAEKNGCLVIFINQLRKNLSVSYGDPDTSPGGHSLKHNASLRLKIMRKNSSDADIKIPDPNKEGGEILMGRLANVKIVKNRYAKPYTSRIEIPIYYEKYFPKIEDIAFDTGRQVKLITVWKQNYKWGEIRVQGRNEFISYIKDNNLINTLIEEIKEKAFENGALLPPEINLYEPSEKKIPIGKINEDAGQLSTGNKEEDNSSSERVPKKRKGAKSP